MGAKEELARLKGLQAQKPTGRDVIKSVGTPKQMMQVAKPKLPQAPATKPKPKAPEFSGRLSGHGMNLDVDTYKESYSAAHDSPSAQRTDARVGAIGHNIVGGFASFGETYSQKVKDRLTNMKNMDKIAPYKNQLDPLKKQRADLLTKARYRGKDAAEKMMGVKLSDLDAKIAEAQKGYNAVVANNPVDPNKYGQRTLRLAAQEQQAAKKGLGKVGSFVSDATIGIGSSAPGMAISVVAPEVGLPLLGVQAAGQKSHELNEQGVGAAESLRRGVISGAIEAGTEAVPIGKLSALAKGTGGKKFIRGILEQSGVEATEEGIAYTSNYLADVAAKDPNAKFSVSELGRNMAMGGFSGGLLGTTVSAGNRIATGNVPQLPNMRRRESATNHSLAAQAMQAVQQVPQGEEARLPNMVHPADGDLLKEAKNQPSKAENKANAKELLEKLKRSMPDMALDEPVKKLDGTEFPKNSIGIVQQVGDFFRGMGGKVLRQGFGDVIIDETGVQSSIAHGLGRAKSITFAAVPEVIQQGKQIDFQQNWKGRGYDSYVFAAPITIAGKRAYVTAVVKKAKNSNKFYLHEVLDGDGNIIYIKKENPAQIKTGPSEQVATGRTEFSGGSLQSLPASGLQLSGVEAKADPIFNSTIQPNASGVNIHSTQETQGYAQELTDSDFGRNTVGSAESAYPRKQKVSKVRSNTIEHSPMFTKAEKEMLKPDDYRYDVIGEKQSLDAAKQRLQVDFSGEENDLPSKQDFSGEDLDTSMGILEAYLDEALDTGDYSKVMKWSKMVQEKGTQGGQLIQSFAKYSRTPEGAVIKAQQTVDAVDREIKKTKPRAVETAKEETKLVEDAVSSAEKEAGKAAAELLPEEMLARRIDATTKEPKQRENVIQDMVNELFRSAKESPLPVRVKIKRSPVDALTKAIQNKEQYADVWEKAKEILKEKYADDLEVSSMLDDYFERGIVPTYSTKTLTGSIIEAVDSVGFDLNQIIKQSKGDKEKLLQDITEYLTTKTSATGEQAKLLSEQIAKRYDEILKEKTASKLNAMFKERPKLTNKSLKEKVMALINMGAYDTDDLRTLVSNRNGIPVLTNEDTKNIIEYMSEAQKHAEGSYDRKVWESRADQIIADKVPATFREKFRGMQRLSMLLNPKTLLTRNPLGNTVLGIAENVKDVPGTMIDKLIGVKTGERTTSISIKSLVAQGEGFVQGLADWTKDIKNHVDTSPSRGQMELPNNRIFNGKLLHTLDIFERRALQLGDRPFYQSAYNGRLAELKKLGVTGEDAKLQARLFALDRVFQNDSNLSKWAGEVRRASGIVGDLIMPFTQTPANVMDKLIDYSPAGLGKAMFQLGKASKDGGFDQKLFVDRMARTFTGSGILMLGYALASAGLATGDLDKDKDVRAAQYAYGITPFSFKFGDSYYSFDWAQPIGGLLSIGANAFTAGKASEDFIGKIMAGTEAGINTVFSQQFLQGVFNMLSGYNPAAGIGKSLLGSTSQATPSGLATLTKTIDPNVRETYDPNAIVQQGKKLAARLPGVSMMLPEKLDAFGNPVMQSQGRNLAARAFENFLSPGKLTTLQHRDVYDELNRLYDKTGSKSAFPNVPLKSFTLDGETINLSSKAYETFSKTQGDIVQKNLKSLLSSNGYKNMSDDLKSDAVAKLYEYAAAVAKSKVSSYKIPDALQKVKDAESKGIKPAEYMVAYAAQKDVVGDSDGQGGTIHGTEKTNKREAIDAVSGGLSDDNKMLLYDSLNAGLAKKQAEGYKTLKEKGMSEADFMKYLDVANNSKGLKDQRTGKTIRGSLKNAQYKNLVNAGMSPSQAKYFMSVTLGLKW